MEGMEHVADASDPKGHQALGWTHELATEEKAETPAMSWVSWDQKGWCFLDI